MSAPVRTCGREGCPRSLEGAHGNARYCSNACKVAAWRQKTGYRLVGTFPAAQTRKNRGSRSSGAQVAHAKAFRSVAEGVSETFGLTPAAGELFARRFVSSQLPARQAARLQDREGSTG